MLTVREGVTCSSRLRFTALSECDSENGEPGVVASYGTSSAASAAFCKVRDGLASGRNDGRESVARAQAIGGIKATTKTWSQVNRNTTPATAFRLLRMARVGCRPFDPASG